MNSTSKKQEADIFYIRYHPKWKAGWNSGRAKIVAAKLKIRKQPFFWGRKR